MNRQSFLRAMGGLLLVPYLPRVPEGVRSLTVPVALDPSAVTVMAGTWSSHSAFSYKWWRVNRDGSRTLVSEHPAYTLTAADVGSYMRLEMGQP